MWTRGGRYGGVWASVQAQRNDLMYLLIGCAHMLVLAGLIEGGFSQITAPVIPYFVKIFFACALFAALIAYLFFVPIKKPDSLGQIDSFALAPAPASFSRYR